MGLTVATMDGSWCCSYDSGGRTGSARRLGNDRTNKLSVLLCAKMELGLPNGILGQTGIMILVFERGVGGVCTFVPWAGEYVFIIMLGVAESAGCMHIMG